MLLAATAALGQGKGHENDSAPEFGVAAVGTVAVLLVGGGVLVARRRRR
ncbi:MAG TPA: LPXTG cell wall anchor domain-containing protein [Myxococcales bacterium]